MELGLIVLILLICVICIITRESLGESTACSTETRALSFSVEKLVLHTSSALEEVSCRGQKHKHNQANLLIYISMLFSPRHEFFQCLPEMYTLCSEAS